MSHSTAKSLDARRARRPSPGRFVGQYRKGAQLLSSVDYSDDGVEDDHADEEDSVEDDNYSRSDEDYQEDDEQERHNERTCTRAGTAHDADERSHASSSDEEGVRAAIDVLEMAEMQLNTRGSQKLRVMESTSKSSNPSSGTAGAGRQGHDPQQQRQHELQRMMRSNDLD